jgi:fructan beta-fructosidase
MIGIRHLVLLSFLAACSDIKNPANPPAQFSEPHRPQIHFSPKENWVNDPNGLLYFNNQYHLFFQHFPDSTVWGPMHWGHAVSKDLVHWQEQAIALFPDSLGYIFSGSAVADINNTSGFGMEGKIPLVAIFTHHDPMGEKNGKDDFQNQSIAYSLDEGKTWIKYSKNPVLKNPGIKDFRDPKVMWYEAGKKWIMTLATKDRITFYSSPNLKDWTRESEFGEKLGAHGGVWECPDLIPFGNEGKTIWVLLVSINPGGVNGGSATQYFVGDFDGKKFTPFNSEIKWIDYGPDNYAGVTFSNTGERKIFLGWMSNWQYANLVPTAAWRNAMTVSRELNLVNQNNNHFVTSLPVKELSNIHEKETSLDNIEIKEQYDLSEKLKDLSGSYQINLSLDEAKSFSIVFSNHDKEELVIGYSKADNMYYIDRTKSGKIDFEKGFAAKHTAPRLANTNKMDISLVMDVSSVELFADSGMSVMTEIFFPSNPYHHIHLRSTEAAVIKKIECRNLKSIWR